MSGNYSSDDQSSYIAVALVIGIIAVLAVSFYYEISTSSPSNDAGGIPVVTVTATKIVYVNASSTSCSSTNQTSGANSTTTC